MRHHLKHMVPCIVLIAALVALRVTGVGAGSTWLPGLIVLACPAMMLWMLLAGRPHQHESTPDAHPR